MYAFSSIYKYMTINIELSYYLPFKADYIQNHVKHIVYKNCKFKSTSDLNSRE